MQSITIKTGTLIDGKGGVQRNVVVSVEGSKITRVEPAGAAKSTYDLSTLTLMPGWIDTHSHPNTHFDKNNRFVDGKEPVEQEALYEAGNLFDTPGWIYDGTDAGGAGRQDGARCHQRWCAAGASSPDIDSSDPRQFR